MFVLLPANGEERMGKKREKEDNREANSLLVGLFFYCSFALIIFVGDGFNLEDAILTNVI